MRSTKKRKLTVFALLAGLIVLISTCYLVRPCLGILPRARRIIVSRKMPLDNAEKWNAEFDARIKDFWRNKLEFMIRDDTGTHTLIVQQSDIRIEPQYGGPVYGFAFCPSSPSGIYVADMDSDGIDDLVYFDVGDLVVHILYRNRKGRFHRIQSLVVHHNGGIIEDVNADGQPDLVLKLDSGYEAWLLKRKTGR